MPRDIKAHILCASLNSRLESNKEEEEGKGLERLRVVEPAARRQQSQQPFAVTVLSVTVLYGVSNRSSSAMSSATPMAPTCAESSELLMSAVQGYLAHKKQPPARTLQSPYA